MNPVMEQIKVRDLGQKEFHQAVEEVIESVQPVLDRNPEYRQTAVLETRAQKGDHRRDLSGGECE